MKLDKRLFFFLLILLFGTACQEESIPNNVLPKEKMTNLLKDLHLTEAYINSNYAFNSDSAKYAYLEMQDSIFKVYETDSATFDSSLSFYKTHVRLLDEIYISIIDSLNMREGLGK